MEKRRSPRVPVSMEVTYETGEDFTSSLLSDVGGGGVFIGTDEPLDVDTRVRVCFHVPGVTESILVTGTVVWNRTATGSGTPGMAVRFDEVDPLERARLERFLAQSGAG